MIDYKFLSVFKQKLPKIAFFLVTFDYILIYIFFILQQNKQWVWLLEVKTDILWIKQFISIWSHIFWLF